MNKKFIFVIFIMMLTGFSYAQETTSSFNFFTDVLKATGVKLAIGLIFFIYTYKNSIKLFNWIEDQTYGTRDYVLQKCELIHFEIEPIKVTYILVFMYFGFSIIFFGLFAVMGKFMAGAIFAAIVSLIMWRIPRPLMDHLVERRVKAYKGQMVDALQLLSNGLRAGLSLPQSLGMVVDELPKPVSQEFNTVLQQTKIGVPLEEAFDNLVKRVPTEDNEMFVSAVNILKETGGNLSEVFDTIAGVIRERVRLAQKIDTYVAQGFFQGLVIFMMPFAMGAMFTISDPASMAPLFDTIIGNLILVLALGLDLVGGYFILKIVDIKV
jgi:tight adherence protein B